MEMRIVPVKMTPEQIRCLDALAELSGTNRSELIRAMIPRPEIFRAISKHLEVRVGGIPTGQRIAKCITNFAVQRFLRAEMANDPDCPIPLQMGFGEESAEELYIKWASAKLGEKGFAIEKIDCDSINVFWAFGPDENESTRKQKKEHVSEYVKTNFLKTE